MPKIRLKTPSLEIEVEGSTEEEVKRSLKDVLAMMDDLPVGKFANNDSLPQSDSRSVPPTSLREGTINTAIASLGGETCKEVLEAAAAHLTLFQGRDRFTDEQWEETSKSANAWKGKWSSEKAKTKKRLIDSGFVIENERGVYSLSANARADLEAKLAH